VRLCYHIGAVSPNEVVTQAKTAINSGFKSLKLKADGDVVKNLECILAVLEALSPDVLLRIDANQGWENFHKAGEVLRELAWNQGLEYVEQPDARDRPEDMRRLSDHFGIPIFVNESVIGPSEAMHMVEANLVDGLCIKVAKCGSLSDRILIANIAALHHLPVTPVSAFGTSLSAAAELQMFCVMPFLSSTVELCHYMLSEELDWPKLSYAPIVSLPETVGIGAEMESDVFA
jgi:L-alanine-DL-glutamate epimerase-like enolase superfamily enzyme